MQLTILKSICLNLIQISTCNLNPLKLITTLKIMVTYRFVLFLHCFWKVWELSISIKFIRDRFMGTPLFTLDIYQWMPNCNVVAE